MNRRFLLSRRIARSAVLMLLLLLAHPLTGRADDIPDRDPLAGRPILAGVFNFDGYHMKDEKGKLEGYGIDLLELLSKYSKLNFIFLGYDNSWQDMQKMLKDGEIDLVSSARRTPEREKSFAFSQPVGRNYTILSTRLGNSALRAGDYKAYNGITVGTVKGSSQNRDLADFAASKGFSYTMREYDDPEKLANDLQAGKVDAILSSNLRKPTNEKTLSIVKVDNFYVIARKEDQALIDEINYAIEQMNLNEGDWQNRLFFKYYGPEDDLSPTLSDRERSFVEARLAGERPVRAIARGETPPYSYVENGRLRGILPDYFAKIMKSLGLPYEFIVPESREEYDALAKNGDIDVVLDRIRPVDVHESDSFQGFTTEPYMETGLVRVMRQDFKGTPKRIAVPEENMGGLDPALLADVTIVPYPSAAKAMDAVVAREADGAYVFPYSAQLYVNKAPDAALYYTVLNDRGAALKMYAANPNEHELVTILNKSIRNMPVGVLNQLSSAYTSFNAGNLSLSRYLRANPERLAGLSAACAAIVALILFLFLRGRWNRRILAATETANRKLEDQLAIVEALSREYLNVFAIDEEEGSVRVIKLAGYNPFGPEMDTSVPQPYAKVMRAYIDGRAHPDDREQLARAFSLENVCANLRGRAEYSGVYRGGSVEAPSHFQFTFVKVEAGNHTERDFILVGFRNIDELIRREQEQKKILSEALERAEYASAAKTAFLNNMSHDIRTPMNAIIGFTTLASSHLENRSLVKRYLGKILTSGNHLLSLINDVLEMSRIESGKVKLEEKENSLPEILHDLRTIVQADVKAKQLEFQITADNLTDESILCDRLRLNQVLLNIVSNAIKYTPAGGAVRVDLVQRPDGGEGRAIYEFTVTDTGIGMSPEFLKNVFEPFEREQTSTVSGIQGTGLGLAITKNIVDLMEGEIGVTSEVGKGSQFTVVFSFRVPEPRQAAGEAAPLSGERILVADGDPKAGESLVHALSSLGASPEWTRSGKEALALSRAALDASTPYRMFFIDRALPDMGGLELAALIRREAGPGAKVYLTTAADGTEVEDEAARKGITAVCAKPVFASRLRELTGAREPAGEECEKPDEAFFRGKRILLAEDNEMNQEIAQMILEGAGFELDIVDNGAKAVQRMEEAPAGHYDLILMDVQMPVMNGYEATRRIRQLADPARAGIPILAMTANAFAEDREEAIRSGMDDYVAKPIDLAQLMLALRCAVEKGCKTRRL